MAVYRTKNGGTWNFSVYVPGAAKRLRGSCGTTDRAEAGAVEALMRMAASRNTTRARMLRIVDALFPPDEGESDDVPLALLASDLERAAEITRREPTKDNAARRRQRIASLVAWAAENWPAAKTLRGVDRRCAQAYAAWLARRKSAKTVRNHVGSLSAIWNVLKRAHDGLENPWPLAMPAPTAGARRGAFSPEEAARLFEAADGIHRDWGLACRIAAATGLRFGDVATLRFGDIRNGAVAREPRKTRKFGISVLIPLPPDLLARVGAGGEGEFVMPYLGGHYNGHALTRGAVQFAEVMAAAGVEPRGRTFHSFRHYFRTQLARAGVPESVAMRLGGWTQKETAARYDHDEHREESAAAVAAAWALTK